MNKRLLGLSGFEWYMVGAFALAIPAGLIMKSPGLSLVGGGLALCCFAVFWTFTRRGK
jgi:hypothetical protein